MTGESHFHFSPFPVSRGMHHGVRMSRRQHMCAGTLVQPFSDVHHGVWMNRCQHMCAGALVPSVSFLCGVHHGVRMSRRQHMCAGALVQLRCLVHFGFFLSVIFRIIQPRRVQCSGPQSLSTTMVPTSSPAHRPSHDTCNSHGRPQ